MRSAEILQYNEVHDRKIASISCQSFKLIHGDISILNAINLTYFYLFKATMLLPSPRLYCSITEQQALVKVFACKQMNVKRITYIYDILGT